MKYYFYQAMMVFHYISTAWLFIYAAVVLKNSYHNHLVYVFPDMSGWFLLLIPLVIEVLWVLLKCGNKIDLDERINEAEKEMNDKIAARKARKEAGK